MTWPFVESELGFRNVLGWVVPVAGVVAHLYLPRPFDGGVVILAMVTSGLLLAPHRRRGWQHFLVTVWCLAPLGFLQAEAMVLEWRGQHRLLAPGWFLSR